MLQGFGVKGGVAAVPLSQPTCAAVAARRWWHGDPSCHTLTSCATGVPSEVGAPGGREKKASGVHADSTEPLVSVEDVRTREFVSVDIPARAPFWRHTRRVRVS